MLFSDPAGENFRHRNNMSPQARGVDPHLSRLKDAGQARMHLEEIAPVQRALTLTQSRLMSNCKHTLPILAHPFQVSPQQVRTHQD